MDSSFYEERIYAETLATEFEQQRPSVLFRPRLLVDGNQFCALYGSNIQEGVAGFGDTADAAMRDFDKNWAQSKAPRGGTKICGSFVRKGETSECAQCGCGRYEHPS